jgi:hypothetical protein
MSTSTKNVVVGCYRWFFGSITVATRWHWFFILVLFWSEFYFYFVLQHYNSSLIHHRHQRNMYTIVFCQRGLDGRFIMSNLLDFSAFYSNSQLRKAVNVVRDGNMDCVAMMMCGVSVLVWNVKIRSGCAHDRLIKIQQIIEKKSYPLVQVVLCYVLLIISCRIVYMYASSINWFLRLH